ncbi:MAG TPA: type II methionyl aminopeptidase [Methanomicrobiales archaeon]|nr:type II methionyl aminopeptidase [Methanomicrobiales archaeon]
MKDASLDSYLEAGKIASRILSRSLPLVRAGRPFLEVVEKVENSVRDEGAGLAFPLNLSLNEAAAHDTASAGDDRVFVPGDVVKMDLGVHLEGYIADMAATVDLGENASLVRASRSALEEAIALVKPGVSTGDLGAAIQGEIERQGFRPVANLTGHGLGRFEQHTPPTVPNVRVHGGAILREGMVFAIEPFASTGTGFVSDGPRVQIYQQTGDRPARLPGARHVLDQVRDRHGLPFARRWLSGEKLDITLAALVRSGHLHAYPVLRDVPGSLVSQAEHTVIVTGDGCLVTTR